jgi:hypothetical protein
MLLRTSNPVMTQSIIFRSAMKQKTNTLIVYNKVHYCSNYVPELISKTIITTIGQAGKFDLGALMDIS